MVSFQAVCVYWRWPTLLQPYQIWFVLLAGLLTQMLVGSVTTFGNLVPYVMSYIRKYSHPVDLRYDDAAIIYAGQIVASGIVQIFGGVIEERIGPRLTVLLGGILLSLGTALTCFSISLSFWAMLLTYGVMYGLGRGILYTGSIACAMRWSHKWKGLSSGFVMSGYGLGSLAIIPIQTMYINHENYEPDETPFPENPDEKYYTQQALLQRVPHSFLVFGVAYAIVQFCASIFLVNPPPIQPNNGDVENEDSTNGNMMSLNEINHNSSNGSETTNCNDSHNLNPSHNRRKKQDLSPLQIIATPAFYMLYTICMSSSISLYLFFALSKTFALEEITMDDHFLSIAGSVGSVFYIINQFLWGFVCDMIGFKSSFVLNGAMQACFFLTFYTTVVGGKILFLIWVAATSLTVGGSIYPKAVAEAFGEKHAGANFGIVCSASMPAGIICALLSHFLLDYIHWYGLFFICGGLMLTQFFIAMFF